MFAAYMTEYPRLTLEFDGRLIDASTAQTHRSNYELGNVQLEEGIQVEVSLTIIEWSIQTERAFHLCDASGISLFETEVGQQVRAPGFNFTVYIKSDHFRELDKRNLLALDELHPDVADILKMAIPKVRDHFRRRASEDQGKIVERWKDEKIYPYEEQANLTPVQEVERQVFDIVAVNVQSYLPSFEAADSQSKKLTFGLLAQALRENPRSVQRIISEVLRLNKDVQDELAELLEKTTLSLIVRSAQIVANRLDFLHGLEMQLFSKETKGSLLERDQLHKILEREAWIFREDFALAGSEERLEEVLNKHLEKLGKREDEQDPIVLPNGKTGRVDLMLSKVTQPRPGQYDYLVVELKRPSQKINTEVLSQVERYALAVAADERFHGFTTSWTFLAVSNELDDFARRKAAQKDRPRGMVYNDAEMNVSVWAKEWGDVINDARSRLWFFSQQLTYEANRDSAKAYLKKAHEKFIPKTGDGQIGKPAAAGKSA